MIYMSEGGLVLERRAKTVKRLSSILSALSSVLSDPTVFLTGGFPPSQQGQTQIQRSKEMPPEGLLNIELNNVLDI